MVRHLSTSHDKPIANSRSDASDLKHLDIITGCTHRGQRTSARDGNGRLIKSYSIGCGLDFDSPAFSYKPHDNWEHQFVITNSIGDREYTNTIVEVNDGKCVVDGKLIDGNELI